MAPQIRFFLISDQLLRQSVLLFYLTISSTGIQYLGYVDAAANKKRFELGREGGKNRDMEARIFLEKIHICTLALCPTYN